MSAGSDRLLTFQSAVDGNTVTGVTFNGMPMRQAASQVSGSGSNAKLWALPLGSGPAISSSFIVSTTGSVLGTMSGVAFSGVNQVIPLDSTSAGLVAIGASTSALSVSSEPGDMALDVITVTSNVGFPSLAQEPGQSSISNGGGGSGGINTIGGASRKLGASPTVNMGWTISSNLPSEIGAHVAANINQVHPAEMNVTGNGMSIADGDTTPSLAEHTDFGSADIATGMLTRTFTVQNQNSAGDAPLNLTGTPRVQLTGAGAGSFTVTMLPSAIVAPAGSTTFQIQFDPSTTGTQSATVTIANEDTNENPYNFAIQGIGTADANVSLAGGVLTVTGGSIGNGLTIDVSGGNLRITEVNGTLGAGMGTTQFNNNTVTVPLMTVSSIVVNGEGGDDTLTVSYSGGNPVPAGGLQYNGGVNGGGDELVLTGGSAAMIEHSFDNPNDGSVNIDGSTIMYTGLEPVTDNMSATNRVFTFTSALAETITLDASGALDNRIDSTQGELVDFTNPTNSLTINVEAMGGAGADTINIQGLDGAFDADLSINGGSDDTVNFQTAATDIGSGALVVTGNTIALSQNVSSEGASLTAQNAVSLTGTATLDAGAGIVSILANQDGVGAEGFSQASGSAVVTSNETLAAVLIDVDGTGPAAIAAVTAGTATGRVTVGAGGAITDANGGATNITAADAVLSAGGQIAAVNLRLQLNVDTVTATSTTGDIGLEEVSGDLTVVNVANASGGAVRIDAPTGDLHVGSGAAVKGSGITTGSAAYGLDDAELDLIATSGQRRVNGDGSADQFNVNYGGSDTQAIFVLGLAGDDEFFVAPATTMPINLDGGLPSAPALPGDTLHLDMSGTVAPVIVDTIGGFAISASTAVVSFVEMETLDLCDDSGDIDNADIGDLYVRTTNNRERITFTSWNDTGVKLRIDDLTLGTSTTYPQHFGLVMGQQLLQQILVYAQGGDDLVSIAGHVVDSSLNPIPVEFHGEDGDDYLTGANADDILVGGPGNDRVLGGEGNNVLYGDGNVLDPDGIPVEAMTDGNDNVNGRSGNDIIFGGGGNDQLFGSDGNDFIHAGSGNDLVDGGLHDDVLIGANGDDNLSGNYGNDILLGGAGVDQLFGRQGDDVLLGGSDADRVRGDAGNDLVVGGNASNVNDAATDAALRAILADWVSNRPAVPAGLGTLQLDEVQDLLIGDLGADAFHRSALPLLINEDRVYDFRASDGDSLL